MEGPGMSLFQGAASIHINNSAQDRLEEQEEHEDQKRRNEELKRKLDNGFDDLIDDDEASSVNSSGNFTMNAPNAINGYEAMHQRTALPPTYVESLHHLKEVQQGVCTPKAYCDTIKNNHSPNSRYTDEPFKIQLSSHGGGDTQNHYFQHEYRGHTNGINNYDNRQECIKNEQLKHLLEMRISECERLASQIVELDKDVDSLRARLAVSNNDKNKAELSVQEAHHLLALSKQKMIEFEQQVTALSEKLMASDQEKEQLRLEVQSTNLSLQEVQQRLHTMKVAHSHDTDSLFREQQDKHREETDRMQADLTRLKNRLDEKENEIKALERRCQEKDKEKEELLIEKGGTINRLAEELQAAQSRLVSGETARLKEKVLQLTSEKNTAREQVKELGSKLEVTAHELMLCRNKLSSSQQEYELWRTTLNQILAESLPDKYIGDPPSPGKLATLKEILSRYKYEMQKISTLQDEISKKDKKLEQHRKQESELRSKLEEQSSVETQLRSRVAVLQSQVQVGALGRPAGAEPRHAELEHAQAQLKALEIKYSELESEYEKATSEKGNRATLLQEANADLLRELEKYSGQLKSTLKENAELKTLYLEACSTRDAATRELKDVQSKSQQEKDLLKTQEKDYVEKIEKEKQIVEKLTFDLSNVKEELQKANKRIEELQKEYTDKQKEFADKLNKYLQDEKSAMCKDMNSCAKCEQHLKHITCLEEQLSKCSVKLASQESNEALMKELKSKAEFFQQYIVERFKRLTDQRSVGVATCESAPAPASAPATASASPHDDALRDKTALMEKEKAIREQIAEKYTLEIKTLEMNCTRKLKAMEDEHMAAVSKLKELLDRKVKEVETLKEFVLAERSKVSQILESKENEISVLIKEHNELQTECQKAKDSINEWRSKAERYKEKLMRLTSLEDALNNEREELKKKTTTSAKDYQIMKTKLIDLQTKLAQIEQKYEKLKTDFLSLQEKYKKSKKTIFTYKDYVAKKDAHINNEMNRIQDEYRKLFMKLQTQINYYINYRIQEERCKGKPSKSDTYKESEYTEKMKKLNDEIARLAKSQFTSDPDEQSQ